MSWITHRQKFRYRHEVHCHLLPGLDDGARTVGESLELIRRLQNLGVEKFSFTPHISWPLFVNTPEKISQTMDDVRKQLPAPLAFMQAGAEYRITEEIIGLVNEGKILPFSDKNVLIEFSFLAESVYFEPLIFKLQCQGYTPVLGHPERYPFFQENILEKCEQVKKKGCLLQSNLLSFAGFYGKETEKAAWKLLKANAIDLVGSDMHSGLYADALEDFLFSSTAGKLAKYHFINM